MKKLLNWLLSASLLCTGLISCQIDGGGNKFDESLLCGKWLLTTENGKPPINTQKGVAKKEYWRYLSDGTGKTWDESDDVYEDDIKAGFTWTLNGDELTVTHSTEMAPPLTLTERGAAVPKLYQVLELTATTLSCKDRLGYSATFTKQSNN